VAAAPAAVTRSDLRFGRTDGTKARFEQGRQGRQGWSTRRVAAGSGRHRAWDEGHQEAPCAALEAGVEEAIEAIEARCRGAERAIDGVPVRDTVAITASVGK
jgi:hypothetical protein